MRILLTNDDGIFAPGLFAVYQKLVSLGDVTVVAPDSQRSGCSHSITLEPINCEKLDIAGKFEGFSISGCPADCVKLAIRKLCRKPFDLVVSGINSGANVGINILYSGTVAAAMEAAFYGIPAVALSCKWQENIDYNRASEHGLEVIKQLLPFPSPSVINVNIPKGTPKGIVVTPQSEIGFEEHYTDVNKDGEGKSYQIDGYPIEEHDQAHTDSNQLEKGYITVSALHYNVTDYTFNRLLEKKNFKLYGGKPDQ
jgi:5'-nucleotidase